MYNTVKITFAASTLYPPHGHCSLKKIFIMSDYTMLQRSHLSSHHVIDSHNIYA